MLTATREVEIEFGDCDPVGIVYYPNYFRLFDTATAHLFELALGMKQVEWTKHYGVVGIPMVDTGANFLRPSRYGDVVTIESAVTGSGRSRIEVGHKLFNAGRLAVEAHEIRVWAARDPGDPGKLKSQAIPEEVLAALSITVR